MLPIMGFSKGTPWPAQNIHRDTNEQKKTIKQNKLQNKIKPN